MPLHNSRDRPREVQPFTDVLNGMAQPIFVGTLAEPLSKDIQQLVIKGRLNPAIAPGATLLVGQDSIKVTIAKVSAVEADAATIISINPLSLAQTIAAAEPVYLLPYDYETQAQVNAPIVCDRSKLALC